MITRFTSIADPTTLVTAVVSKVNDLVLNGRYHQTLRFYLEQVHLFVLQLHANATISILPSVVKACSSAQSQPFGLQLHCTALKMGLDSNVVLSNSLVSLYPKFSATECARKVFDSMPYRDRITWSCMINSYIQTGWCVQAVETFKGMHMRGFVPKPELVAGILSICGRNGGLGLGRAIHALLVVDKRIQKESVLLSTALVDFYMRCHDSLIAFRVFDRIMVKNEVTWTALISGCIANHNYAGALDHFLAMQAQGFQPNRVTLLAVLPALARMSSNTHGKEIHGQAVRHGFDSEPHFSAALVHMYSECGESMHSAELIFERTREKDVVMWSSMITSYSRGGYCAKAMKLFGQMRAEGTKPNSVTLLALISACTTLSSLTYGQAVHGYVFTYGSSSHVIVGNSLINMYSKCGSLMESQQIFQEMPLKDSVSWSTLISAYGLHGHGKEALQVFHDAQERGVQPDATMILAVLSACNHAGLVEEGKELFNNVKKDYRFPLTLEHYACFIDLLARSGKLEEACEVVCLMPTRPTVRIWSSLVSASKIHGRQQLAEMLVDQLIEAEPDNATNYTLLSMVYAESCKWLGVEQASRIMRVRGLKKSYGFSRTDHK